MISGALRGIQLISGFATGLLGLFLFIYIATKEPSTTSVPLSTKIIVFVMAVGPGLLVAIGTYLQVIRGKIWGMAFIFPGTLANMFLVIFNAGLLYAMSGDMLGQRAIMVDLLTTALTFVVSWPNALLTPLESD